MPLSLLQLVQKYGILRRMKRRIEKKLIQKWVKSVGGTGKAVKIIMEATDIAPDTAAKLARGEYPYEPQFLIRKAICELTGKLEDELFPFVGAKGKAS